MLLLLPNIRTKCNNRIQKNIVMGWKPVFYNWDKPTTNTTHSFYKLLKQSTKAVDKAEKLVNKIY
jgi:hypothetical protein